MPPAGFRKISNLPVDQDKPRRGPGRPPRTVEATQRFDTDPQDVGEVERPTPAPKAQSQTEPVQSDIGRDTGIILQDEISVKPEGKTYRVLHGAVGRHSQGSTVYASQLVDDTNITRLIDLGAIKSTEEDDSMAVSDENAKADDDKNIGEIRKALGDVAADSDEAKKLDKDDEKAKKDGDEDETVEERLGIDPADVSLTTGQPLGPAGEPDHSDVPASDHAAQELAAKERVAREEREKKEDEKK